MNRAERRRQKFSRGRNSHRVWLQRQESLWQMSVRLAEEARIKRGEDPYRPDLDLLPGGDPELMDEHDIAPRYPLPAP